MPQPPSPTTTSFFEYDTGVLAPVDLPVLYAALLDLPLVPPERVEEAGVISRAFTIDPIFRLSLESKIMMWSVSSLQRKNIVDKAIEMPFPVMNVYLLRMSYYLKWTIEYVCINAKKTN